jgi:hypothetical protein
MKWIFVFVFMSLYLDNFVAQTVRVKRKYCKVYEGEIPKYNAILGQEIVEIAPIEMRVTLKKDSIYVSIGNSQISGVYSAQKSTIPNEITLTIPRENSGIEERINLNTADKTLTRKGVFPQPDVVLIRMEKSKR